MRRIISGLLLAASTMVPGLAAAQNEGFDRVENARAQARERAASRPADVRPSPPQVGQSPDANREGRWRGGNGWRGNNDAPPRVDAGATFQRPDRGQAGWQGNRDRPGAGNWRGDRRPPLVAQPQSPPPQQGFDGIPGADRRFDADREGRRRFDGNRPDNGRWNRPGQVDQRRDDWTRSRFDQRDQWRDGNRFEDRADWNRGGNWSRSWRQDNRFDYGRYRAQNRFAYHLPRYYAPYGWQYGYRRFGIGVTLSSILLADQYWIDDPYDYRLPPAYGPYRWVRYYNDALLVDIRYGVVVDTVYDIFW